MYLFQYYLFDTCDARFILTGAGGGGGGMRGGGSGGRGRGRGRGSKEHQLLGKTIRITRGPYKGGHSLHHHQCNNASCGKLYITTSIGWLYIVFQL